MNNPTLTPHYLTSREASIYLGCSTRTVSRMVANGTLRAHTIGRLVRFTRADLDAVAIPTDTWK